MDNSKLDNMVSEPESHPGETALKEPGRRRLLLLVAGGILAVVILVLSSEREESPYLPVPKPNGYELLCQAAAKVQKSETSIQAEKRDVASLGDSVAGNRQALEEIRRALAIPGVIPIQDGERWFDGHLTNLANIKAAALAMDAEASLLFKQGNLSGALTSTLDLLRFSQAASKGGLVIDHLVGLACEGIARQRILNILPELGVPELKRAANFMENHESRRESLDAIRRRDEKWSSKSYHLVHRVQLWLERLFYPGSRTRLERSLLPRITQNRALLLRVAARAYTLEHGKAPQQVSDLIPEYLSSPPLDPATQKPMALE